MKKIIFVILAIIFLFNQSASFAAGRKNFEELLLHGDMKSVENELRNLYKNKIIDSDELISLDQFVATNIMQSIVEFNDSYDKYLITRDEKDYDNTENKYYKIKSNYNDRIISRAVNYFSDDFIDIFNDRIAESSKQMSKITEIYNSELYIKIEEDRKQKLVDKLKKEEQENKEIAENKRQKEAEEKYIAANSWAENNIEYAKPKIVCEICQAVNTKKEYEEYIKKEKQYASKYGVVNLSTIEEFKVGIIGCDNLIREKNVEYKNITGNKFNFSACNNINLSCSDGLDNIKVKLIEIYLTNNESVPNQRN